MAKKIVLEIGKSFLDQVLACMSQLFQHSTSQDNGNKNQIGD